MFFFIIIIRKSDHEFYVFLIKKNAIHTEVQMQNAKIFKIIHLRWFIIRICIGKRKKKDTYV